MKDLVDEIIRQLDDAPWKLERERDGVAVYSCGSLPCPVVGFRTVTFHEATIDELFAFLGDGLLDAFSQMNERWVEGCEIKRIDDKTRIVRTSFSMPPPLANREFVHVLHLAEPGSGTRVIAYRSIDDDPDLPPVQEGYVRCPIYPSGQRLTEMEDGRVRVEHLMVYDLAGSIRPFIQNVVFHRGHVAAYHAEWSKLVERFGTRP